MTYSVCWIEVMEGAAEGPDFGYPPEAPLFTRMGPAPSKGGPYWLPLVERWSKDRGHEIDWVDNCWARVGVSAAGLLDFLVSVVGEADSRTVALRPHINVRNKYIVVAEEF